MAGSGGGLNVVPVGDCLLDADVAGGAVVVVVS